MPPKQEAQKGTSAIPRWKLLVASIVGLGVAAVGALIFLVLSMPFFIVESPLSTPPGSFIFGAIAVITFTWAAVSSAGSLGLRVVGLGSVTYLSFKEKLMIVALYAVIACTWYYVGAFLPNRRYEMRQEEALVRHAKEASLPNIVSPEGGAAYEGNMYTARIVVEGGESGVSVKSIDAISQSDMYTRDLPAPDTSFAWEKASVALFFEGVVVATVSGIVPEVPSSAKSRGEPSRARLVFPTPFFVPAGEGRELLLKVMFLDNKSEMPHLFGMRLVDWDTDPLADPAITRFADTPYLTYNPSTVVAGKTTAPSMGGSGEVTVTGSYTYDGEQASMYGFSLLVSPDTKGTPRFTAANPEEVGMWLGITVPPTGRCSYSGTAAFVLERMPIGAKEGTDDVDIVRIRSVQRPTVNPLTCRTAY